MGDHQIGMVRNDISGDRTAEERGVQVAPLQFLPFLNVFLGFKDSEPIIFYLFPLDF